MKKRLLTLVIALTVLCSVFAPYAYAITYYIEMTRTSVDMIAGEKTTLHTRITPVNLQAHTVVWSSSNPDVASVNQKGVVKANTPGMALISAEMETGSYASCYINVEGSPVTILTVSEKELTLTAGETCRLTYTMNTDADDRNVEWSTTNGEVAVVNEDGLVKAKAGGECDIIVKAANGITAQCHVTVPVSVTKIQLLPTQETVGIGETIEFDAYVFPGNAQERKLTWTVSDSKKAAVDENGVFTAVAKGKVKVKAEAPNGVSESSTVTILQYPEKVELNNYELNLTNHERKAQLKAKVLPADAEKKTIKWSSSDENIATVNDNGWVDAKGYGTCIVKAYTSNGIAGECTVNVRAEVASVSLDKDAYTLILNGETTKAFAAVEPKQAEGAKLKWTSSDEKVVTVDENGVMTPVAVGEAKIKVSGDNGAKAVAVVHVKEPVGKFAFETDSVTIGVYCTKNLKLENDSQEKVTFESSNTDIAIVNTDGMLVGKSEGECVITATLGDELASTQIDVAVVENTLEGGKLIALIFDDGPSENTSAVLDKLAMYGINATFFMVGKKAEMLPDVVKAVYEAGNEIGNRTYKNGNLENGTPEEALKYIHGCDEAISALIGITPSVLRAPGEGISYARAAEIKGDRIFIDCTLDSNDTFAETPEAIVEEVLEKLERDAEIILMHDTQDHTAEALNVLIPELLQRGYRFVTMSQMMNMVPDNNDAVYDGIYLED